MPTTTLLTRALADARTSPYLARIGVEIEGAGGDGARAQLRYTEANANRGGAVHGGALAALLVTAAELAAAASEREGHDVQMRAASAAISFLEAVRKDEDVVADARVLRRGRDTVHVVAEARRGETAVPVATALFAYTVLPPSAFHPSLQTSRAAPFVHRAAGELAGSAYMSAGGARIVEADAGWSCMTLPKERNEAAPERVHDGAMLGLVDTCAAIAAFAGLGREERPPSATVTLSAVWSGRLDGDLVAGARLLGRAGGNYTCEAEAWSAADRRMRASALICYRVAERK
jgi:acyl-coenzyme A thioesterase 13